MLGISTTLVEKCGQVFWYRSSSSSGRSTTAAVEAVSREILVGISRRTCKMVELMSVVHRVPDFDPVDSVRRVGEALWMLFLFVVHLGGVLMAVKMFLVLMTFDGVLRGSPVATVLVYNFLKNT